MKVDGEAPLQLHPNSAKFKKWGAVTVRVAATVFTTYVVTIVVLRVLDTSPTLRPVTNTVAVALFAGLVGLIIGPAGKVADEYRQARQQLKEMAWEILAAFDASRNPVLDDGKLLALLIDQFA